jgi:hypothetical protein
MWLVGVDPSGRDQRPAHRGYGQSPIANDQSLQASQEHRFTASNRVACSDANRELS